MNYLSEYRIIWFGVNTTIKSVDKHYLFIILNDAIYNLHSNVEVFHQLFYYGYY